MIMKCQVSPQYLREEKIYVTIIEVKSPVHYVIKESPSMDTASTYASKFLELEESLQKYYRSLEKTFFQLPVKDTVLIVEHEKKYYRAKVCSILNLPRSYLIKVYLLDYGKECSVPKSSLFEIHPDFLSVPFQVIEFQLPGLEPMSLVMNSHDLTVEYGTATDWDSSASVFIEGIRKALRSTFVKVEGVAKNCIFGTLHVTFQDGEEKCVNDELVFKKFAAPSPECWNDITRLTDILSKDNLESNLDVLHIQSNNPKVPMASCNIPKSLPASELSSAESLNNVKSPGTSTIVSESSKNVQKSGVTKLREILKAKKSQVQGKSSPEGKKESASQSKHEENCLNQKDLVRDLEESKVELLEDITAVHKAINEATLSEGNTSLMREPADNSEANNMLKNVNNEYLGASKDMVLKTTEENKCDQKVSASPNASTFQKLREMVARKKAAQKQQSISLTLSDNSCLISPSQTETVSPSANVHSSELDKSVKLSQHPKITLTQQESVRNVISSSIPASNNFEKAEEYNHKPANSISVQDVRITESAPAGKSDSEQSVGSQASNEQEQISKKVDPRKIKAFFERNKKARALFLAQNKSKQDQNNASLQFAATSPTSKPSEINTQLVVSDTKIVQESCKRVFIDTKDVLEESCRNNSVASKLELADKSSESHSSVESQMSTEENEIAKSKVDSGKLKSFFERNRKHRALFLAQIKSTEDQDNNSLESDITSHPSIVPTPCEADQISTTAPETYTATPEISTAAPEISTAAPETNMDVSRGNDSDILDLVNESSDSYSNR